MPIRRKDCCWLYHEFYHQPDPVDVLAGMVIVDGVSLQKFDSVGEAEARGVDIYLPFGSDLLPR
jgi:hypothetical protein